MSYLHVFRCLIVFNKRADGNLVLHMLNDDYNKLGPGIYIL